MPANVGEMFYVGEVPWHGIGLGLSKPATLDEALRAGGLEWRVGTAELMTGDDPPSPVKKRMALVRMDRPHGHEGRVLGVAHRGFKPVQNAEAGMLFDAIFGHGRGVYCTGGYLGDGEVVWLMAKLDPVFTIGKLDEVQTYALMANSHDGSLAFNIQLTTVRVVCQNTLTLALQQRIGPRFRRSHQGSFLAHATEAGEFFRHAMQELGDVGKEFTRLSTIRCSVDTARRVIEGLFPDPKEPRNVRQNPGLLKAWESRREAARVARARVMALTTSGKGMELEGSRETFWGLLNAVIEYIDHHAPGSASNLASNLLGDGMQLKSRAFRVILAEAAAA